MFNAGMSQNYAGYGGQPGPQMVPQQQLMGQTGQGMMGGFPGQQSGGFVSQQQPPGMMGASGPMAPQQPRGAGEFMGPQGGMTAQQRAMSVQQGARPPYLQVCIERKWSFICVCNICEHSEPHGVGRTATGLLLICPFPPFIFPSPSLCISFCLFCFPSFSPMFLQLTIGFKHKSSNKFKIWRNLLFLSSCTMKLEGSGFL